MTEHYSEIVASHPGAVWDPRTGQWSVPTKTPRDEDNGGDDDDFSAEIKIRIATVRKAVHEGYISHDEGQRLINEIIAENT